MSQSKEKLKNKLQELRDQFENTRPYAPEETRPFTYQKLIKGRKSIGNEKNWEWVTEDSTVTLRILGVPEYEHRIHDLSQQIINIKALIKDLEEEKK